MTRIQLYAAQHLIGEKLRFYCDCTFPLDITGVVADVEMNGSEVIYIVNTGNRLIKIGSNHPGLEVEPII